MRIENKEDAQRLVCKKFWIVAKIIWGENCVNCSFIDVCSHSRRAFNVNLPLLRSTKPFILNMQKDLKQWWQRNYLLFIQGNGKEDKFSITCGEDVNDMFYNPQFECEKSLKIQATPPQSQSCLIVQWRKIWLVLLSRKNHQITKQKMMIFLEGFHWSSECVWFQQKSKTSIIQRKMNTWLIQREREWVNNIANQKITRDLKKWNQKLWCYKEVFHWIRWPEQFQWKSKRNIIQFRKKTHGCFRKKVWGK